VHERAEYDGNEDSPESQNNPEMKYGAVETVRTVK
jgi:hypothetical protein